MKKEKIVKRLIAVIVAVITAFGGMLTVLAATSASDWNGHHRFKVDGNDAYCINFGEAGGSSGSISGSAWDYWNEELSASKREKIELAVTAAHQLGYHNGTNVQYFGVQYYIWLITNPTKAKNKLSSWFKNEVNTPYTKVKEKVEELENVQDCYLTKGKFNKAGDDVTLTANADYYSGYWQEDSWSATNISKSTTTSGGKVRKTFSIPDKTKKASGTLKMISDKMWYVDATKNDLYKFGPQEVLYIGEPTTISYTRNLKWAPEPIPEYSGKISIQKKIKYGSTIQNAPSNKTFKFKVKGKGDIDFNQTLSVTGSATAISEDIDLGTSTSGTVTVTETDWDSEHYVPLNNVKSQDVTVKANQTTAVNVGSSGGFVNVEKLGDFCVKKRVNDINDNGVVSNNVGTGKNGTNAAGFTFRLVGVSDTGRGVNFTSVTNGEGIAYFCNVPLGKYKLEEISVGAKYINTSGDIREIEILWDKQTNYSSVCTTNASDYQLTWGTSLGVVDYVNETGRWVAGDVPYVNNFVNTPKQWRVKVQKVDSETGQAVPQGDASLAGAKYELHREYAGKDTIAGTYTTGADGSFTTDLFTVFGDYYIIEIKPSKGYEINNTKQYVFRQSTDVSSWGLTTLISNTVKAPEKIKKAPIAVQKYANIEGAAIEDRVPEENAEFEIYLKSAGSYAAAKDKEKDYLVTDENGYAKSKDLPYGTYVVHQVKSNSEFIAMADDVEIEVLEDKSTVPVYETEIINTILTYSIRGYKYNRETSSAIAGAEFGLFKSNETDFTKENALSVCVSDENGAFEFSKLVYDKEWLVKELKAAEGYIPNDEIYRFNPDITEKTVELKVANDLWPELKTTAQIDGKKEVCATEVFTLTDTVAYQHLIPGKEYTVKGVLMDKSTGKEFLVNGETVTSETTFIPEAPSGTVDVLFTFDSKFIKTETDIVVFESLYKDGKELAVHTDINDKEQTVTVKIPEIKTSAKANGKKEVKAKGKITITDTVKYTNLTVGKEYVVKGVLMDKATGKPFTVKGKEITAEVMFTPQKTNGKVNVPFTFDGSGITAETEVVVFETLYREGIEIATHTDLKDKNQTVKIIIPQTPKTPKTGDKSNRRKLATVFGASLFGMLCLAHTFLRKRKKEKETNNES